MKQKKKVWIRLLESLDLDKIKRRIRKYRRSTAGRKLTFAVLIFMILAGSYLLIKNQSYSQVQGAASYARETSDSNSYAAFSNGIIRYSRDGVVFLDRKNREKWIQPCQIQNPVIDITGETFAVADIGGNSILVFTEEGIKGEIETTLPIERVSVSGQGIVTAILKNESTPQIVSYDAAGNILVEHQVNLSSTGYPIAIDMSQDGNVLAVSYLSTKNGVLKTKVAHYNFGEEGKAYTDNLVQMDELEQSVVPDVFFMDASTSVAVSDSSFTIYEGTGVPKKIKTVGLNQEIRSEFHTEEYIGFVLVNVDKTGYEVQLYDRSGKQVMNRAIAGEYSNVKMSGDEIIMFEETKGCIISSTGVQRFCGDWGTEVQEIVPAAGINRYLLVSADEFRIVYLTK